MRKVRSLLSVLLVCCLLVNVVPVKSKAVGATAAVVGVSAAMVAASALIGLGVSPGEDSSVFTGIVQNLVDGLESAGFVAANGLIDVFSFSAGNFRFGLPLNVFNFIRDSIFDSGIIRSENSSDIAYNHKIPDYALAEAENAPHAIFIAYRHFDVPAYIFGYSFSAPIIVDYMEPSLKVTCSDVFYMYKVVTDEFVKMQTHNILSSPNASIVCMYFLGYADKKNILSDFDLSIGTVTDPSCDLNVAYPDWAANSITIPADEAGEDEDVIVYPIGLGPDYDTTISKPQEDVWAGTSEYEIEAEGDSEAGTGTETGLLSSILSAVKSIPSAFEGWFKDLIDLAGEIGEAIIGLPARIKEALTSLFQDVVNVGQAVVDAVLGIPQAIADVLTAIFVPDQAYVESKVDAVYAQFPFIQSIIATGEELKGAVSGSSGPPVIYVDLGLAPSGDFGRQKVLLTDFSWYEPYKQRVDTLLSAALWALFGWRMYLRLPSIISGEGGIMIASERAYRKLGDD